MDVLARIAEDKIKEAIKNGELDNLAGMGKPLQLTDDLPGLSPELKMGYRLLKNSGFIPEELNQTQKEMVTLEDLLACCDDKTEQEKLQQKLTQKKLRFDQLVKKRKLQSNSKFGSYAQKIYDLL